MKNKIRCLTAAAAALAAGVLPAVVDENLAWKWDTSGRVEPPSPVVIGAATAESDFNSWGFCRVSANIRSVGIVIMVY